MDYSFLEKSQTISDIDSKRSGKQNAFSTRRDTDTNRERCRTSRNLGNGN